MSGAVDRPPGRGKRIVLADDQPDALESMAALFEAWGHEVHAASNGEDAIALVLARRPDVVVLDLKMPGMGGLEVARSIRRVLDPGAPFLVALTALSRAEDRELAQAAGFDAFVVKPPKLDELRALLAGAR